MNNILSIATGGNKTSGVIHIIIFSVFQIIIGGVLEEGTHFHLGFRFLKYEAAFQLHSHDNKEKDLNDNKDNKEN